MSIRIASCWLVLVLTVAVADRWRFDVGRDDRCGLDGSRIQEVHRVDLMVGGAVVRSFCSIRCAQDWPATPSGANWRVRDEITGQVLDAERAHFVVSRVVCVPARQDRTHIFANWTDAQAHIERFGGRAEPNPLASAN